MHVTFLGTAASEGYPDAFCNCERCAAARAAGGKDIRRRSAALINDDLLIDFGPDVMASSWSLNVPLHGIRYVLQTHEHSDHLDVSHFGHRSAMSQVPDVNELTWFASRSAADVAARQLRAGADSSLFQDPMFTERLSLQWQPLAFYEEASIGPYRVFSVPAHHGDGIEAMLHCIEWNGSRLFYATDTGPLPDDVWDRLADAGWQFDMVVMDHTFGLAGRASGHLNGEQFLEHMDAMRKRGLSHDGTRVLATHIAHHSNPLHDELDTYAKNRGYEVAYDGLGVTL